MRRLKIVALLFGTIVLIVYSGAIYLSSKRNSKYQNYDNEEIAIDGKESIHGDSNKEPDSRERDYNEGQIQPDIIEAGFSRSVTIAPTTRSRTVKIVNGEAIRKLTSVSFTEALNNAVNDQRQVMIAVVDIGYVKFALNFQRLCVDRLRIKNFLMVCVDELSLNELAGSGIGCTLFDVEIREPKERIQSSVRN